MFFSVQITNEIISEFQPDKFVESTRRFADCPCHHLRQQIEQLRVFERISSKNELDYFLEWNRKCNEILFEIVSCI